MTTAIQECWAGFLHLRDMRALQLAVAWAVVAALGSAAMSTTGLACLLTAIEPTPRAFETVLLLLSGYAISATLVAATVQLLRPQGRKA